MGEKIAVNLGPQGIAPSGTGRTEYPYIAAAEGTIMGFEVRASNKNANNKGISISIRLDDPVEVDGEHVGGLVTDAWLNLPEGNDFSNENKKGKGNRARVADIKSMLVSIGACTAEQATALTSLDIPDGDALKGMKIRFQYEPSLPPQFEYAAFTWLSPQAFTEVRAGVRKVALQNDPNKKKAGAGIPVGAASTGSAAGLMGGLNLTGGGMQTQQPSGQPPVSFQATGQAPQTPPPNGAGAGSAVSKLLGIG